MAVLCQTPEHLLIDSRGRPYFLWDTDMTLADFEAELRNPDPEVRGYLAGKLMRQAKPDDVFRFLTRQQIRELWPHLERYLGDTRAFWSWLFEQWRRDGDDGK